MQDLVIQNRINNAADSTDRSETSSEAVSDLSLAEEYEIPFKTSKLI